jgi:ribosomal protein L11 methyltransferase
MRLSAPNYIWRKSVAPQWLSANEPSVSALTSGGFAVIEKPGRKRVLVEAPCQNETAAKRFLREFGGKIEKLPARWLDQFLQVKATKPIRIGTRLLVGNVGGISCEAQSLVIPAGVAFGTGEHATTAMSLRLLEKVTRRLTSAWRMLDAGTGSGILALAGKRFGAGDVVAIDNDPLAISTAKQNARCNQIRGVKFVVGDVAKNITGKYDIITANLYSELLVSLLPQFRKSLAAQGQLILSGVLCQQEPQLVRALKSNAFQIPTIRRRGKWIALLAIHSCSCS